MKKNDDTIKLFNLNLFSKGKAELLKKMQYFIQSAQPLLVIFTPNAEQVVFMHHDRTFAHNLGMADVLFPDGAGILWASRLMALRGLTVSLSHRSSGLEVVEALLKQATSHRLSILIVGGRNYHNSPHNPFLLNTLSTTTPAREPGIHWLPAYANIAQPTQEEEKEVSGAIRQLQPQIVLVAFGAPYQERWIIDHKKILSESGVAIAMVVGGACDVLFGKLKRPPRWMSNWGLEWLYRLMQEPWRWKRQLKLVEFVGLTLSAFLRKRPTYHSIS